MTGGHPICSLTGKCNIFLVSLREICHCWFWLDKAPYLIFFLLFVKRNQAINKYCDGNATFDHPAFVNQVVFWSCLSLILCVNTWMLCQMCFAEWQKYQSFLKTETMQFLMNSFILAYQVRTISGLRVIDNGVGPLVFGAEETIVDFALLAADQKATLPSQVQTFYNFEFPRLSSPSARLQLRMLS